jgi:altronate hydrolase
VCEVSLINVDISSVAVLVDPNLDNVAVAKQTIPDGTQVVGLDGKTLVIHGEVLPGHRFAIRPVADGEWLLQYGQPFAISHGLQPGDLVNSETARNVVPQVNPDDIQLSPPNLAPWDGPLPTFEGYLRPDGRAGVRNCVLIVPTSNCSSHEANTIAMQAEFSGLYTREKYPNVDGVSALPHTRGCGCPDMLPPGAEGRNHTSIVEATMRLLADHIQHPNVGAALLIELGCEKTNLAAFNRFIARDLDLFEQQPASSSAQVRTVRPVDLSAVYGKPVYSLSIQACGGTRATIQRGLELVAELLEAANATSRTTLPASQLVMGLKCGGSDAFSGLTANPALGHASDLLIRAGGTSIITEIPEFFGAEHLFAQRAASREVAREIFGQIQRYREYTARNGAKMDENPSPGNKEGGLLNITIKSLGAIAKAGTAPVQGGLDYGQPYWRRGPNGLYIMYGPGYDTESVPALVAGGCQIVCFTTGRGSVLGNAIAPVVKIATNTPMYQRMSDDMDVNAGEVLDGTASLPEMGRRIFEKVLAVASGAQTRPEVNGHREFTIWSEEGISL